MLLSTLIKKFIAGCILGLLGWDLRSNSHVLQQETFVASANKSQKEEENIDDNQKKKLKNHNQEDASSKIRDVTLKNKDGLLSNTSTGTIVLFQHTSNWDIIYGILYRWWFERSTMALSTDNFAQRWPILRHILKNVLEFHIVSPCSSLLENRPSEVKQVDRQQHILNHQESSLENSRKSVERKNIGTVQKITAYLLENYVRQHKFFLLSLSPKGHREKKPWRSGYYHIAKATQANLMVEGVDYRYKCRAISPSEISFKDVVRMNQSIDPNVEMAVEMEKASVEKALKTQMTQINPMWSVNSELPLTFYHHGAYSIINYHVLVTLFFTYIWWSHLSMKNEFLVNMLVILSQLLIVVTQVTRHSFDTLQMLCLILVTITFAICSPFFNSSLFNGSTQLKNTSLTANVFITIIYFIYGYIANMTSVYLGVRTAEKQNNCQNVAQNVAQNIADDTIADAASKKEMKHNEEMKKCWSFVFWLCLMFFLSECMKFIVAFLAHNG